MDIHRQLSLFEASRNIPYGKKLNSLDGDSHARVLNMKKLLPLLLLATLAILATLPQSAFAHPVQSHGDQRSGHGTVAIFTVALQGSQQVPPVTTNAFGFVIVRLFHNGTSNAIDFHLIVCNIANVTHAHIHV